MLGRKKGAHDARSDDGQEEPGILLAEIDNVSRKYTQKHLLGRESTIFNDDGIAVHESVSGLFGSAATARRILRLYVLSSLSSPD